MIVFGWTLAVVVATSLADRLPSSTERAIGVHRPTAYGPAPTKAPQHALPHLLARSYSPYSTTYGTPGDPAVCGYMTYDPLEAIACYPGELCSGSASAFACCAASTVSTSNLIGLTQGLNCTPWAYTKCYPYSATESCTDSACYATAAVCTDMAFPECFTAGARLGYDLTGGVFGKDDGANLTAALCEVISTSLPVHGNWLYTYSTSVESMSDSSTGSLAQTPGSTMAFSTSQASAGSESAIPSVGQASASPSHDSGASMPPSNTGTLMLVSIAIVMTLVLR